MKEPEHPADRRIRELADGSTPRPGDSQLIRSRIARAPFYADMTRTDRALHGRRYHGRVIGAREPSDFAHLVKRVLVDRQWSEATTFAKYLADLQQFATNPRSRICVYDLGNGPVAALFGPNPLAEERTGVGRERYLFVVYAADRRCIISGYQVSSIESVRLPEHPIWLP